MITKQITAYGRSTPATLDYLLGPAHDESSVHLNARVVGGWREGLDGKDAHQLADLMDLPVVAARLYDKPHVWHVSVSTQRADGVKPADRPLDDATFAAVAKDLVDRCGMGETRWLAVRHDEPGKEHAHIVATTVADGKRKMPVFRSYLRMRDVAHEWEDRLGLQPSSRAGEGRPTRSPSRGEMEKAKRNDWSRTPREDVQSKATRAARDAQSVADFIARMERQGSEVVVRRDKTGRANGFAVRAVDGIWFKGSQLDRDLKKLMYQLESLSRTVDVTREVQVQATRAAAERRSEEHLAAVRRAYTLPDRVEAMER